MSEIPLDRWQPISPDELLEILRDAPFDWCVAGGHAIERFVGSRYRDHGDIDVVVYRPDQLALQNGLRGWSLHAAAPPGRLRPWLVGERLGPAVHDVWGHREGRDAWELQILLQDADDERWFFRGNPAVGGLRADHVWWDGELPCISIPVQLLYKSRLPRAKDHEDFERCAPRLTPEQREELRRLLSVTYPEGHAWLRALSD